MRGTWPPPDFTGLLLAMIRCRIYRTWNIAAIAIASWRYASGAALFLPYN